MNIHTFLRGPVAKYLIVGGCAFCTEYFAFFLLYQVLNLQVYVANSVSFCTGLFVSFVFNRAWTFKTAKFKKRIEHQFAMYASLAAFNLLMTNVIIGLLKSHGIQPLAGKIIAMLSIVVWNFLIYEAVIFKSHPSSAED